MILINYTLLITIILNKIENIYINKIIYIILIKFYIVKKCKIGDSFSRKDQVLLISAGKTLDQRHLSLLK